MHHGNSLTLGADRALYLGDSPATGWHRHAAPVFTVGLSGRFAIHLPGGRVVSCRSALVDLGIEHVFDPCGEQVATMYLEPDSPEARSLRPVLAAHGGLLIDAAALPESRSTMEARLRSFDLNSLLRVKGERVAPLDPRVERCLQLLRSYRGQTLTRAEAAGNAFLSSSRFNHLFSEQMGVSFRDYRVWAQLRLALSGLGPGVHLTQAAHEGGFADSAHFSRSFRSRFAMTPSSVLKSLKHLTLL